MVVHGQTVQVPASPWNVEGAAETFPNVTAAIAVAGGGLAALKVGALGLKFAGLMVGRTPAYLGKSLQARDVRLLVVTLLVMPLGVLVLAALAVSLPGPAIAIAVPNSPSPGSWSCRSTCTSTRSSRPTRTCRSRSTPPPRSRYRCSRTA